MRKWIISFLLFCLLPGICYGFNIKFNAGRIRIPQVNEPATPTLSFGDGDTGFYESSDDVLVFAAGGVKRFVISSDEIYSDTGRSGFRNTLATATLPNILPNADDTDTGVGRAAADALSLIAGGIEGHRITEVGGAIDHIFTGAVTTPTTQTLTGAGAVDIISTITHIVTTAANALTLADGLNGQTKFIVMKTDAGDGTLTPTNPGNFATITFNDVGDSAQLLFTNGKWYFMGGTATLG